MKNSIIIPAHNIEKTIKKMYELIKEEIDGAEIIISEDGSTDKTREIALSIKAKDKNLMVLSGKERLGKGGGLVRGFEKARGNNIIFIDGDLSIQPSEIKKIIDSLKTYDVVFGSRRIKESKISKDQPLTRKILGTAYRYLVRILFHINAADTQCGLKGMKREVYEKIKPLEIKGWSLDLEILAKATKKGFKIKEIPIQWKDSGNSSLSPIKASIEMLKDLIRIKALLKD